jgi:HK97 family phage portal protein
MGILGRLAGVFKRSGVEYEPGALPFGGAGWSAAGGSSGHRNAAAWVDTFETHCWLQAVVSRIATDEAKTEWIVLEDDPKTGSPREVRDHALCDFLANPWRTNVGGTMSELVWMMSAARSLDGNAYLRVLRDGKGAPLEVWPIPHQSVDSVPCRRKPWFEVSDHLNQVADRLPPADVIWLRRPAMSNLFGKGKGIAPALDDEISQDIWAAKYNNAWFRNGARPDIIVEVSGASKLEQRRMEEEWAAKYKGYWNAFKTAFINSQTKVHQLTASHKDMEFATGRKLLRDIIFQTFGIPPEIMGVVENSNRATADAALYIYSLQVVFPRVKDLCENLNRLLVPLFIGGAGKRSRPVYLGFENPVRETEEFKLEKGLEAWKSGLIQRDQALEVLGFDPVGGLRGEEYLVPVNMQAFGPSDPRQQMGEQQQAGPVKRRVTVYAPREGAMRSFRMELGA